MLSPVTEAMRASLRNHGLTEMAGGADVRAFRMHRPGTRIMSVDILFSAGRIWISGDLQIGQGNGVISSLDCDLEWFTGRLGWDYLASKFLQKGYVEEHAKRAVKDEIEQIRSEYRGAEMPEREAIRVRRLDEALHDSDGAVFRNADAFIDFWASTVGQPDGQAHGYDPIDAGWLSAVQQRFADLFSEMGARKTWTAA